MSLETVSRNDWKEGQLVKNDLDFSWVYEGTENEGRMARERVGEIIEVPMATREAGSGTVRVHWSSLNGADHSGDAWRMWVHTDHLKAWVPS